MASASQCLTLAPAAILEKALLPHCILPGPALVPLSSLPGHPSPPWWPPVHSPMPGHILFVLFPRWMHFWSSEPGEVWVHRGSFRWRLVRPKNSAGACR